MTGEELVSEGVGELPPNDQSDQEENEGTGKEEPGTFAGERTEVDWERGTRVDTPQGARKYARDSQTGTHRVPAWGDPLYLQKGSTLLS